MSDGFPVVLTADRTLTADYRLLFDGMLAASQTTTAPPAHLRPSSDAAWKTAGRAGRGGPVGTAPHRGRLAGRRVFARGSRRCQRGPTGLGHRPRHAGDRHLFRRTGRLGNEHLHHDGHRRRKDLSRGHVPPLAAQDTSAQPQCVGEDRLGRAGGLADCGRSARLARNWASTTSSPAMPKRTRPPCSAA